MTKSSHEFEELLDSNWKFKMIYHLKKSEFSRTKKNIWIFAPKILWKSLKSLQKIRQNWRKVSNAFVECKQTFTKLLSFWLFAQLTTSVQNLLRHTNSVSNVDFWRENSNLKSKPSLQCCWMRPFLRNFKTLWIFAILQNMYLGSFTSWYSFISNGNPSWGGNGIGGCKQHSPAFLV